MISERAKNKLKLGILFGLYRIYHQSNCPAIPSTVLAPCFKKNIDQHDIALALRSLKADGFIKVDFDSQDEWGDTLFLTQKGIDYCYENNENELIKYLKQNHLAIIAIVISIIALFY